MAVRCLVHDGETLALVFGLEVRGDLRFEVLLTQGIVLALDVVVFPPDHVAFVGCMGAVRRAGRDRPLSGSVRSGGSRGKIGKLCFLALHFGPRGNEIREDVRMDREKLGEAVLGAAQTFSAPRRGLLQLLLPRSKQAVLLDDPLRLGIDARYLGAQGGTGLGPESDAAGQSPA